MTDRLYYTDAYLHSFAAQVTAVNGSRVVLDRTAFYPTSGGQQHDTGTLGDARVIDVVDDASGIVHVLDAPATLEPGHKVTGTVDAVRRFDHMQQHTGQHLLSALFEELAGARTVSVHFGDALSTLDIDAESLTREVAVAVEARANVVVSENRAVNVSFEDAAAVTDLRKESERSGILRIVTIAGLDRSACGGTHVRATGEIGAVLVRKLEKYKKLTRVEFLCGSRAVRRVRADYDALSRMAAAMSAGIDELPVLVAAQGDALRTLESGRRKLAEALASHSARELYDATTPDVTGIRRIRGTAPVMDDLRFLAHAVTALPKAVFIGTCEAQGAIILAASGDSGVNAGADLKAALTAVGGRGGGNPAIAQGTAPREALAAVASALARTS
jgi:alanyl-tRNA synthetase